MMYKHDQLLFTIFFARVSEVMRQEVSFSNQTVWLGGTDVEYMGESCLYYGKY